MSVLKCWTGSMFMLLAMAGGVHAEMTVSQSNDPAASLGVNLTALLGQEKTALGAVSGSRLEAIVAPKKVHVAQKSKTGLFGLFAKRQPVVTYDRNWVANLPAPKGGAEYECLAKALYFESRGEGVKGQAAVAEVVLNRVESPKFPSTVCGVVNQGGSSGCQFSFTCDGYSDAVREKGAWMVAEKIAGAMLDGTPRALTDGATYFHTSAVRPSWSRRFEKTTKIGSHIFYRVPIVTAMN
ncbi:MAG: cell wall hydrolase [Rhodobacteraceae bacterium]|nr:cell wall hydrolase [Paracoccaceae bacterium]MCP5342903.1 cell wall hydrolase [Paracoccaceae bacterium]